MSSTAPLNGIAALVQPELDRLRGELLRDLRPGVEDLMPLVRHVGEYQGKQLRPAMVLLAGKAVGVATDDHVHIAKVVELLHTATLVHDDVLDGAHKRRRIPTVNAMEGTEVAVLLGDYIYAKAFHMAVQLDDPTCARWLAETVRVICQGEITQILHRYDFSWDRERYYRVIADKTASLYEASCHLGGHYAGGSPDQLQALRTYGRELGIAFQIVDDCLDLDGDEAVVGKSLGTDLVKGKLTLPLLHLMEQEGIEPVRALMASVRRLPGSEALVRLRSAFDLESAMVAARVEAEARVDLALLGLEALPLGPAREALARLGGYVLDRRR